MISMNKQKRRWSHGHTRDRVLQVSSREPTAVIPVIKTPRQETGLVERSSQTTPASLEAASAGDVSQPPLEDETGDPAT